MTERARYVAGLDHHDIALVLIAAALLVAAAAALSVVLH
jgi:hypothetical protein